MGNDAANQNRTRKQIKGQRRGDAADGDGIVMAYGDDGGVDRSVQGDEEAPHLKTPPFPTEVTRWFSTDDLQSANAFVFTTALDVYKRRLLSVWFDYDSDADDLALLIVPQARRILDGSFFTISVIDPLLTRVQGTLPFSTNETFGRRDMMATMLRIPPSAAPPSAVESRQVLQFDVSAYSAFRLGLSNGADDGALTLDYNFAE